MDSAPYSMLSVPMPTLPVSVSTNKLEVPTSRLDDTTMSAFICVVGATTSSSAINSSNLASRVASVRVNAVDRL